MIRPAMVIALLSLPHGGWAQTADAHGGRREVLPDGLEWRTAGAGLAIARVEGDPSVPDAPYTVALRLEEGAWIPPHWHPRDKRILVISGTVLLGWGDTIEGDAATALPVGGFALVPGTARHYEGARGPTVFMLYGTGPLTTTFVPERR